MRRVTQGILCIFILLLTASCQTGNEDKLYANPPHEFQNTDLVGTWEARYHNDNTVEQLAIRSDGTCKQTYRSDTYSFETGWNKWRAERFSDGRVWLYLEGAHYFNEGIVVAEGEGWILCPGTSPRPLDIAGCFWDPVGEEYLDMQGELILNVRACGDCPGGLVLKHMRFPALNNRNSHVFYQIETP